MIAIAGGRLRPQQVFHFFQLDPEPRGERGGHPSQGAGAPAAVRPTAVLSRQPLHHLPDLVGHVQSAR